MLDTIKKQLKMESLLAGEDANIMQKYKYYAFLLDMFRYGIVLDELKKIMDREVRVELTEVGLNVLNSFFRENDDDLIDSPLVIDLIDDFSVYEVRNENVLDIVVTPETDSN